MTMLSNMFGKKEDTSNNYLSSLPTVQAVPIPPPSTNPSSNPSTSIHDNSNTDFLLLLERQPTMMAQCPSCNTKNVRTFVRTYPSFISWIIVAGFFLLCWPFQYIPMYFIPFAFLPMVHDKVR